MDEERKKTPKNPTKTARARKSPALKRYERNRAEHLQYQIQKERERKSPVVVPPTPKTPEEFVALAEAAITKNIANGDTTAIIFTLKTMGASRGWIEHSNSEVDLSKVHAYKDMFSSITASRPRALKEAPKPEPSEPGTSTSDPEPQISSAPKPSVQVDPGSRTVKISLLSSNFP